MNKKEIVQFIEQNKEILPLSYNDIEIKQHEKIRTVRKKLTASEKYNDKYFDVYKPNKPTTRF